MPIDTPWRYTKLFLGKSPYDILKELQKSLKLSEGDIRLILTRTRNLKDKMSIRGRSNVRLILSCTYLFINWKGANKSPINIHKYTSICNDHGYKLSKDTLINNVKLFKAAKIFPIYTKITDIFEGYWSTIKQYFELDEKLKNEIMKIIENSKITSGRSRNVILAGSIYYVTRKHSMNITQSQLAKFLGVSEVSIRNFNKIIREVIE